MTQVEARFEALKLAFNSLKSEGPLTLENIAKIFELAEDYLRYIWQGEKPKK